MLSQRQGTDVGQEKPLSETSVTADWIKHMRTALKYNSILFHKSRTSEQAQVHSETLAVAKHSTAPSYGENL